MTTDRNRLINSFLELGRRLQYFGKDASSREAIRRAEQQNGWFQRDQIIRAIDAIREQMLSEEKLHSWLARYPTIEAPKRVGVIMAGNLPLVEFFDLLCVAILGHKCYIKPSSKDTVLIEYIVGVLEEIAPQMEIHWYEEQPLDAVIATGGENAKLHFKSKYSDIPSLLRGSRSSVAIITGQENDAQLMALAYDLFSYSGLGCRNVSKLFVPEKYDLSKLVAVLSTYANNINPKYVNNYKQRKAILQMQSGTFIDGRFFILQKSNNFPLYLSEITYNTYNSINDVDSWLKSNEQEIQCVVHNPLSSSIHFSRSVNFGDSQSPGLLDYADDVDTIDFLTSTIYSDNPELRW